jgi:hypothetical protein
MVSRIWLLDQRLFAPRCLAHPFLCAGSDRFANNDLMKWSRSKFRTEGAGYPQRRATYLVLGSVTPNQPATSLLNFFSRVWTSLTPLFTV